MSLALINNKKELIRERASLFAASRTFFEKRGVVEVDVPILSETGSVDVHIDLIEACVMKKRVFLHSSPEYGMKQLLAQGVGDIYQISHVFRDGERGPLHSSEFVMVEWYRLHMTFEEMIEETLAYLRLFVDECRAEVLSYDDAFEQYGSTKWQTAEERDHGFAFEVQPALGQDGFTIIIDFPVEEAALARIVEKEGRLVARRFEIFYKGVELANGYEELIDVNEQRHRLLHNNRTRQILGKCCYPLDEDFLAALEQGVPPCSGVAVGFDRLMMLRRGAENIKEVLPI